ncbi:hypothetical protein LDENG_00253750 [Lucifuga dentata]|nr:hypothetical protein LDENG_00253750 [Lucifuga dentata]
MSQSNILLHRHAKADQRHVRKEAACGRSLPDPLLESPAEQRLISAAERSPPPHHHSSSLLEEPLKNQKSKIKGPAGFQFD